MKKIVFSYFLCSILFLSCTKKTSETNESVLGLDYYPTTKGKYAIYQVDSTIYTDLPKDTIEYKYLIKEKIADSFIDNTGKNAIRIERYIKKYDPLKSYDSIAWTMKEVFLLNADNKSIQVVENNVRYTKLTFPVQTNAIWDGNANNSLGTQNYRYEYIDRAEKTINNKPLDNVLLVIQKEFHPKTLDYYYAEKYAKGLGLVYKEITDVISNSANANFSIPVLQRIESGFIYKQSIISFGYE